MSRRNRATGTLPAMRDQRLLRFDHTLATRDYGLVPVGTPPRAAYNRGGQPRPVGGGPRKRCVVLTRARLLALAAGPTHLLPKPVSRGRLDPNRLASHNGKR